MKKFESLSEAGVLPGEEKENVFTIFDDFQEKYPPITGTFSADPKEILKFPKERRKEVLHTFSDTLDRQRHALAACRMTIEKATEYDPTVPKQELMAIIDKYADNYAFSEEQRKIFEHVLNVCYEMRRRAVSMRKEFPNDADLVNELCGTNFGENERFDISVSFIGIDITLNAEQLKKIRPGLYKQEEQGGFAMCLSKKDRGESIVCYTCVNRDYAEETDHTSAIQAHEAEHLRHYIFMQVFKRYLGKENSLKKFGTKHNPGQFTEFYKKLRKEGNSELALEVAGIHLSEWRRFGYEQARDEIFAMAQNIETEYLFDFLRNNLLGGNAMYNFLQEDMEYLKEEMENDSAFLALVEKYLVTDYREGVEEGIRAFVNLIERGNYSKYAAVALLTDVPLQDFPKTVNRLLKNG